MNIDLYTVLNITVVFVLPILFPLLVTACLYWYKRLIAALPDAQRAEAVRITQMGVAAIEQIMGNNPGSVKRQQAIAIISSTLKAAKINVSSDLINIALEEAVHAMNTPDSAPVIVQQTPVQTPLAREPLAPEPQPIILAPQPAQGTMPVQLPIVVQPGQQPLYIPNLNATAITTAPALPSWQSDIHFGDTGIIPTIPKQ